MVWHFLQICDLFEAAHKSWLFNDLHISRESEKTTCLISISSVVQHITQGESHEALISDEQMETINNVLTAKEFGRSWLCIGETHHRKKLARMKKEASSLGLLFESWL